MNLYNQTIPGGRFVTKQVVMSLLLFIGLYFSSRPFASAQLTPAFTQRLDKVFDSICTKLNIKGASAAVLVPGGGTWKGVHGISRPGTPIRRDMLFSIGSNTKTFVASTMLRLQEQGLLNLNDTIGKWIVNKKYISGKITIRQLLNHTSGLYNYTKNPGIFDSINSDLFRFWKMDEILHLIGAPYFAPGAKWDYSNTNYIVAGIIIEKVTNKSIQAAIREYVLVPAGLDNTIYPPFETSSLSRADQWSLVMGKSWLVNPEITFANYSPNAMFSIAAAAGGLMQTAEDNVNFWHKLTSGQILSTASFKEMRQYIDIGGGDGYGLGIFFYNKALNGRSFYSHGGTSFGYINENLVDTTSHVCISVLTNQDSIDNDAMLGAVIRVLHKVTLQVRMVGVTPGQYQAGIYMFPNPASGLIYISSDMDMEGFSLVLTDISGKQQFVSVLEMNDTSIDLAGLNSGYYFATVMNKEGYIVHRQKICVSN